MGQSTLEQRPWLVEGEAKRAAVRGMFGEIAPSYDLLNSLMSLGLHRRWRRIAVRSLGLSPGDRALDVCCGTGDFLRELRAAVGPTGLAVGVDFCLPMLDRATRKGLPRHGLHQGDATRLPYRDRSFDAVTVGWGIRNVHDIDGAHREAFRVLKPGGRFVSLDMARPRTRVARRLSDLCFRRGVPWLGALFGKAEAYRYLPESTQRFLSREELADSLRRAGFVDVLWRDFFLGNVCMIGGRKP